jgi:hypothetical protein
MVVLQSFVSSLSLILVEYRNFCRYVEDDGTRVTRLKIRPLEVGTISTSTADTGEDYYEPSR